MVDNPVIKYSDIVYKKNGRIYPEIDCWGFLEKFYIDYFGIKLPAFASLCPKGYTDDYLAVVSKLKLAEKNQLKLGSLIGFFRNRCLYHVGVAINGTLIAHHGETGLELATLENLKKTTQQIKVYEPFKQL